MAFNTNPRENGFVRMRVRWRSDQVVVGGGENEGTLITTFNSWTKHLNNFNAHFFSILFSACHTHFSVFYSLPQNKNDSILSNKTTFEDFYWLQIDENFVYFFILKFSKKVNKWIILAKGKFIESQASSLEYKKGKRKMLSFRQLKSLRLASLQAQSPFAPVFYDISK